MKTNSQEIIKFYDYLPETADFQEEVINGLNLNPRFVAPKFFYDEKGSKLFDEICMAPEYYVTRTEIKILEDNLDEISAYIKDGCLLIEPGSGSSQKVRTLLNASEPHAYLPMDISADYLRCVAEDLAQEYPWLEIHAVCVDYTAPIHIPELPHQPHRVAFFPGSSIGNFEPDDAVQFLSNIANLVNNGGGLLIGVDLKKDNQILNNAYNDSEGSNAAFNLNLLDRANSELGANFNLDTFTHKAFYNDDKSRIEMHLISDIDQQVRVSGQQFEFKRGQGIHTENSYKYTIEEFQSLARKAGFTPLKYWTDPQSLFSVHYFEMA